MDTYFDRHGALRVVGTKRADAQGRPVQLREGLGGKRSGSRRRAGRSATGLKSTLFV